MKFTYTLSTLLLGSILLTGGCSQLQNFDDELDKKNAELTKELGGTPVDEEDTAAQTNNQEQFASVQDYTGEGFKLPNSGDLTAKLAAENKEEITHAVKNFFKSSYKTEVTVHNMAGARDGISVFVESVGEPHFHTFAIVPVSLSDKKIVPEKITSLNEEIEGDIESGLYAMLYKNEINELNQFVEEIESKFPVTGLRMEAINNTTTIGYTTPQYYIATLDDTLSSIRKDYIQNPERTLQNVQKPNIDAEKVFITIELYMKDKDAQPMASIHKKIVEGLKEKKNLPPGDYSVILNDNRIDKSSANGVKRNSIDTENNTIIID